MPDLNRGVMYSAGV